MNFRFKALQKLSEPDQLDMILRLSRPRAWAAVAVLAASLGGGVVWAYADHIPRNATGDGILTRPLGVAPVQSRVDGLVTDIAVDPGAQVVAGQTLVDIQGSGGAARPVTSPFPGRVISLAVIPGQVLNRGTVVATVERTDGADDRLLAMVAVPASNAKSIRPGAPVTLAVSDVPSQAFGLLEARVTSVEQLPLDAAEIATYFADVADIGRLVQKQPYVLVRVDLDKDASTTSGYRWSSSGGPPYKINSQVEVTATILVSRERPIDLVING